MLATRHLAIGKGTIQEAGQLTAPMNDVLDDISEQLRQLKIYKAKYGELVDERITEIQ